jgi:hypothetical protein
MKVTIQGSVFDGDAILLKNHFTRKDPIDAVDAKGNTLLTIATIQGHMSHVISNVQKHESNPPITLISNSIGSFLQYHDSLHFGKSLAKELKRHCWTYAIDISSLTYVLQCIYNRV